MTQEEAPTRQATQEISDFAEIAEEFNKRVARIVWCTVATVDAKGRPRTRILHPIWEANGQGGVVGYIATNRHSYKERHIAANPGVSLSYWDQQHEQVYVDATADWLDSAKEKQRIWDFFKETPPPYGYDPALIWREGLEDSDFGVLRLKPRRIELFGIADLMAGRAPRVWRAD
ncbi:MAG TPA: pyridoxamine 5'-phosphate oxidase family protein [Dehalococcoidia bacterium]|nr:pyridoxamine 5'-phosphate oxidase family protein [Dehalococcoidia bacterium]